MNHYYNDRAERLEAVKREVGWNFQDDEEANGGAVSALSEAEARALEGHFMQVHVAMPAQDGAGEDW